MKPRKDAGYGDSKPVYEMIDVMLWKYFLKFEL